MNGIRFECVQRSKQNAEFILKWRNDPETLRMSFHQQPKVWESFYQEFCEDYFNFSDLPPLFALSDDKRVAFLRFRPVSHPDGKVRRCCDISINVSPEERGRGVGTHVLKEVRSWVHQQGYDDLYAEVKVENAASRKAFEAAGFVLLDEIEKEIFDTGESVRICRYLAALREEVIRRDKVLIIAEAGSNWRMGTLKRDLAMAKALIDMAAEAGADAVKFQTYRPETIYVPNAGKSNYLSKAGIEEEMAVMFEDLAMPYEMVPRLAEMCQGHGVQFMSSAFSPDDFAAVDPYVSMHKIASYEIGHIHLLALAAKSGKPLLLSTGAATEEEIAWAVNFFYQQGGHDLTLLQCTACYPALPEALHLRVLPWLAKRFDVEVGLSDHSPHPFYAPVAAVALGAKVIEKHVTLDKALPGPDHAFAITPKELKDMVEAIRKAEKMVGKLPEYEVKAIDPTENELRLFARRGIQALKAIKKGEVLTEGNNMAILRPGEQPQGVHPRYIVEIEGKRAERDIPLGHGLKKGDWK